MRGSILCSLLTSRWRSQLLALFIIPALIELLPCNLIHFFLYCTASALFQYLIPKRRHSTVHVLIDDRCICSCLRMTDCFSNKNAANSAVLKYSSLFIINASVLVNCAKIPPRQDHSSRTLALLSFLNTKRIFRHLIFGTKPQICYPFLRIAPL